ncbi:helix-turn-helix domain-containing protein [Segnochrobactrum spirostomi]|uniref:Helix-turn-helix transcriptional regulator n=1 Tax=Segnochrobactrum spirostomi TaxID=2608987 RepID=A0A6A7Y5D8_9HYPH|nr:helix-turn-helix transcriptional regulator [Segnochrobactrum spirostomi]MQT14420.1 helix-turn-helix transcriptional regulator [Segnochrobactrum spirostomi]
MASDTIASRLLEIREKSRQTQRGISNALGIAYRTWQDIEKGKNVPSGETLLRIAQFGYSPTWVLTGQGPMELSATGAQQASQASSALDVESLTQSIQIVQDWLTQNRRTMPADRQAEVIALIYDLAMQEMADGRTTVDMQRAARFLRLVG